MSEIKPALVTTQCSTLLDLFSYYGTVRTWLREDCSSYSAVQSARGWMSADEDSRVAASQVMRQSLMTSFKSSISEILLAIVSDIVTFATRKGGDERFALDLIHPSMHIANAMIGGSDLEAQVSCAFHRK